MSTALVPLLAMVSAGLVWQRWAAGDADAARTRRVLGALTVSVFAPALVLDMVLRTRLEPGLLAIPAAGLAAVGASGAALWALYVLAGRTLTAPQLGALALATVFGNGLGMALPVVEGLMQGRLNHIPLAYDLTVTLPLVWTVGALVAARLGGVQTRAIGAELLRLPPFLALLAALAWKLSGLPIPGWVLDATAFSGRAAVPLLALMVGLSLRWPTRWPVPGWIAAAVGVRMLVAPLAAWALGRALGLEGEPLAATVLTAAAPSVIVGVALCDRYRLDGALFGAVLTVTTAAYVLAAPLYLRLVSAGAG